MKYNIPEKCIKHPYYLWPRLCDRLEATGNIGLFRAYDYTNEKKLELFFAYFILRLPMSVHSKLQPIRSSRLTGYRQHIYMNVLFYYIEYVKINKISKIYHTER